MEGKGKAGIVLYLIFTLLSTKATDGLGGWNLSDCKVNKTDINYTTCQCNHLTHSGILMYLSTSKVDEFNEHALRTITCSGSAISSTFMGMTIVIYQNFHTFHQDSASKILLNLCAALLMLNISFLASSWFLIFDNSSFCVTLAVMLHYFLLSSFTWMGLQAVHMYLALFKVFKIYMKNYIFKVCIIGWGIPAGIIGISLLKNREFYGFLKESTRLCWFQDNFIFYFTIVGYFCLIFLINVSIFLIIFCQINSIHWQKYKTWTKMILHDLKSTSSLTFLMGLTWGLAFFARGPMRIIFLCLFSLSNITQGFVIFIFHCLLKEDMRKQLLRYTCVQLINSEGNSRYELNYEHQEDCEDILVTQFQDFINKQNPCLPTFMDLEPRHNLVMDFQNQVYEDFISSPKLCVMEQLEVTERC
ncbi:adhesion G-protein coupled receptor G4 [Macrotis lagotis]|uniref:adhesion G-protein coupled receptor G4 n=1 Tax=Macrotis lagotis TaxID=92651 RepID=UPI003D68B865